MIPRELDPVIARAVVEAHARWPGLPELGPAFDDAILARVEGELDIATVVPQLALPDLYLVTACLRGDKAALVATERLVRDETHRAVAKLGTSGTGISAEDVIQELLVKLLVPHAGKAAKLAAFGAHGALPAWIRVAAVRTAISMSRKMQAVAVDDEALVKIADESDDQALAFLKSSYRAEFKRAFTEALAELPKRARTLLRLQVIDQLTLEEIGAFYAISRATTARHLADARSQLVTGTQRRLAATLGVSPEELAELMKLVASTLYATLPRILGATTG